MSVLKRFLKYFSSRDHVYLAISSLLLLVHLVFLAYDLAHCNKVESAVNDAIVDDKYVSITWCSNVPIKRKYGTAPNVEPQYQEFYDAYQRHIDDIYSMSFNPDPLYKNKFFNKSAFWNVTHLTKKNEMELLSEMVKLDETERMYYSLFPDSRLEIILRREADEINDPLDYYKLLMSNNLLYGNCITFNPSLYYFLNPKYDVQGININNDVLQHRNGMAEQPDMPWKRQILVIHPFNTEPLFDSRNIIKIPAHSKSAVTVTKTAYAHEVDCEEIKPEIQHKRLMGQYMDERNYTYSYEGCLASCLQNLTVEFCSCQLPHLQPINSVRMCRGCRLIPQRLLDGQCGCKYPCSYFDLLVSTELLTPEFNRDDLSKFTKAKNSQLSILNDNIRITSSRMELIKLKANTQINILIPKLTDTRIVETKCKFVVVLSQIGGILSLYIGLSVVSFVEIAFYLIMKFTSTKRQTISKYSLSVSNQFLNSNLGFKIFWILILLAAGCATFAQTWTIIQRYNQFPIVNQIQEVDDMEFPSVTVCSNNILIKQNHNFSINDLMTEQQKRISELKIEELFGHDVLYMFGLFLKQNATAERLRRGPSINQYMPTCYYSIENQRVDCREMTESSIGSLGNCVTVNSEISLENGIERNVEKLTMELKMTEPEILIFPPIFGTSVIIHPKGTSPNIFNFQKALDIPPSYIYDVAFTMTIIEREPEPYPSKCVSPTSPYYQWTNMFHSHETPYLYTKQSCESSCAYNQSKSSENLDHYAYEQQGREEFPLELYSKYGNFSYGTPIEKCECRIPCREVNIETEVTKNIKINNNSSEVFNISSLSSSWLTIRPKSRKITLVKEIPAIQLWTLISEIGGTIGLYIGASLLALIELNSALIFKLFKLN